MADKQARVEISTGGTEEAAAAARKAMSPWVEWTGKAAAGARTLKSEFGSALGGVVQDLGRVVTVGSSISFAGAVSQVQSFERATSQLSVAMGSDFEKVKAKINGIGDATGKSGEQVANFVLNVGRASYDFKGAADNVETFRKAALDMGRELTDTGGLATSLKRMGVEGTEATTKIVNEMRALGGGKEGFAALADQVTALSDAFGKSTNGASQLIAITSQLGKGLPPQQAAQVQQSVIGTLTSKAAEYEAHFRRTGELKPGEYLIDRKTGRVDIERTARLVQGALRRQGERRGFLNAAAEFGGPQAAAAFMGMDLGKTGALAEQGATTDALKQWLASPGGKQEQAEAAKLRSMQQVVGHGSMLGTAREWFTGFAAEHPFAGKGAELGLSGGLGWVGRSVIPRLFGAGGGGGGGAAAQAAKSGVGRLAPILGEAAPFLSLALGQAQAIANLKVDPEEYRRAAGVGLGTGRAAEARAFIRAAERSGGTEEGFIQAAGAPLLAHAGLGRFGETRPELAEAADPVLASLVEQLRAGSPELKDLPADVAQAVKEALQGSPLQINVITQTPVEVEQPGGQQ